jgi:O-antigen/teichoic acid export membrane protein
LILNLIGRITQFIIAVVSMRVMTQLLSPDQMGRIVLITTTTAFFALFLINPVGMFINRRLHSWVKKGVFKSYLLAFTLYLLLVALVSALVVSLMIPAGILKFGVAAWLVASLVAGSLLFNTMNQTLVPSLNLLGQVRPFVVLTLGTLITGLILAFLLVTRWEPSAQSWLLGILGGQAVFAIVGYVVFFRLNPGSDRILWSETLSGDRLKKLFDFCWPVAVAVGFNWVQMQGYRYYVAAHTGLVQFGLFATGYSLAASMLAALETLLTTWFMPGFYQQANSDNAEVKANAWMNYARLLLPASLLGLTALVASTSDIVPLFLGSAYQGTGVYVMLGAVAEWVRIVVGVFVLIAHLQMRTKSLIYPNFFGALFSSLVIFALLPLFGLYVVPLAVAGGGVLVSWFLYRSGKSPQCHTGLPLKQLIFALVTSLPLMMVFMALHARFTEMGKLQHVANLAVIAAAWAPLGYWSVLRGYRKTAIKA